MKILIYFFSGTGNTEKISELYSSALAERGHDVTIRALPLPDMGAVADADEFDMIGIGYPIHAFNAPKMILKLCKALPKRKKKDGKDKKRVFVFKSSGEPVRISDVSSLKMRAILRRRGYDVTNEYQHIMPYNVIFRHGDGAAYKMWQTATRLVPANVKELLDGKTALPKKMLMGGALAWIMRCEHWGAHINGKLYRTNKSCVSCSKCVKLCPVHNIRINKKGKLKFGGKCIMCVRCAMYCPKNAIELGLFKSWKVNGAYSFEPPAVPDDPNAKHANYCKKAYDRYYRLAEQKIRDYEENLGATANDAE